MAKNKKLLILAGDGIGPEVMRQVARVLDWFGRRRALSFEVQEGLVGGCSIDKHGVPITDATMADAMAADAVLLGAVGGPKWDNLPFEKKPERGLLRLRKDMELFANLRPALVFDALADASSLKPELVRGLDLMIVRELTGGVYFGSPRGIETLPDGTRRGVNTQVYTTPEIIRVAHVAFQLARQPKQFDVIVTDNLFGDLLSDCAAMLTGSLGMLPSASLGAPDATGRRRALYEPVHGSAPDIAGKDLANPLATLLSVSMMLRYSFGLGDDADLIDKAAQSVLAAGIRTGDIATPGATKVSTTGMGDAMLKELDRLAGV
jgi:3-isopropylmalate dehydrogenase